MADELTLDRNPAPRPDAAAAIPTSTFSASRSRSWSDTLTNVWNEIGADHVSMMAAGVAFYALLSIFPAMSAVISIYGLVSDPGVIARQIGELAGVLPSEALKLLSDQLQALIAAPPAKLGIGLLVSLMVALWSATNGISMMMQTLSIAYEEEDDRGILYFYALAIGLTIGMIAFGLVALLLIAVIPAVLDWLPLPENSRVWISLVRWPILAGLIMVGLTVLYRFAPRRRHPRWELFNAGTIAATLLWIIGSAGFSLYVSRFNSYDRTYGSIGAVVVLLMWFYVSAFIVLAGAELNAEISGARSRHKPPTPIVKIPG